MSIELKSYTDANNFGTVQVKENVWGIEPNVDLMHMASVRQQNNARLGTACTKTRTEVRGSGRKPWKQKGTGRARAGTRTSPVWRGGGVVFGPRPRSFKTALNRKMSAKALASALSANREQVVVVADAQLQMSKTRDFAALLNTLNLTQGKILFLTAYDENLYRATRNLPNVNVVHPQNLGVTDVLKHAHIVVSESALKTLEERLGA